MNVAILGAGAGGLAAAVELACNGHRVRLWNRSAETIQPLADRGTIEYAGVFGNGALALTHVSTDLNVVLKHADAILVCLPTNAHKMVASLLAQRSSIDVPVILNPGHTGGVLEFTETFRCAGKVPPKLAELSTLTYVARKSDPVTVCITGSAKRVWVACLPGADEACEVAQALYPAAVRARDILASGLANVNVILHPPGAILGAAWVESTGGNFTFYVEGLPEGVGRVMEALDQERLTLGAAYDHSLPPLFDEMQAIGTIEESAKPNLGLAAAIRGGTANQNIRAPETLAHRYYTEDFCFGLQPFIEFADIAKVGTPVARSLMMLASILLGPQQVKSGRTAASMGIKGLDKDALLRKIRA